jgi:uncharacterized protein (TIGR03437 family)
MKIPARRLAAFAPCLVLSVFSLSAQQDRVPSRIDRARRTVLSGRVPLRARAGTDLGRVPASFSMPDLMIMLKGSTTQQQGLAQLLREQQDPASPKYHHWLTPEQYADQFGVSQHDADQVVQWLQSQGFTGMRVARSRMWISFSGNAQQVQAAFGTPIDRYSVNGTVHYANAADPSIPTDLAPVIAGIRGLHNFRWKPRYHRQATPQMTNSDGSHSIAPDDFATIYNVAPLYNQDKLDGTGQKLAVVGQTDIVLTDINKFRTKFNLGTINLTQILVPKSADPGVVPGDVDEAALDIEWSSAVARNASILYYYSSDVWTSATEAVNDNQARVISMSYGACELYDLVDLPSFQQLAQQANAQGITWVSASGDSGATDCEDSGATIAQNGFAVDVPSSIPEITGMGGTEFNEGAGGGYWNSANNANGASAVSYIPERIWNDTAQGGGLAAGGGGASIFFPQPSWQTGPGVPSDGARHVPDLSFSASAEHDGYYVYSGGPSFFGGTSAAAPTMAGIVALLNQYLAGTGAQIQPGLGNINPTLYRLAQTSSASEVFHDVTAGDNGSPCATGTPNCVNGVVARYAGPGYDMASGLGSVNAYNLVHSWSTQTAAGSSVVISIDQNPVFELSAPDAKGNLWSYTLTLSEEAGIPTTITGLKIDGTDYTSQIAALFGSTSLPARQSISASLGFGSTFTPHPVLFAVSGVDVGGRVWTTTLSIPFTAPRSVLTVGGVSNAASGQQVYAPGELVSVYGTGMGSMAQSAATIPLPQFLAGFEAYVNNVPTPIWYVSPNQVNLQIPYETAPGSTTLTVGNPWENVNYTISVAAAGPGIFTFPAGAQAGFINPFPSAARGQTVTLFITGEGAVRPSVTTGSNPNPGTVPTPRQTVTVTVGGVAATTTYVGIPGWSVGVTQINYTIPTTAPTGVQPVVVTVGTAASLPAKINITQ